MSKRRILIIDDEVNISRVLRLGLETTGNYVVEEQNDSLKALATARAFQPDLIVLDVMMPNMDGAEVAARIHADPVLKSTPIIFQTSVVSKQEVPPGAKIGRYAYLAKPASLKDILLCIERNLVRVAEPTPRAQPLTNGVLEFESDLG